MTEEGSPSALKLRGFRIQKKPTFVHTPQSNGSLLDSSSEFSPESQSRPKKRRILPIQESDSETSGRMEGSDCEIIEINDEDDNNDGVVVTTVVLKNEAADEQVVTTTTPDKVAPTFTSKARNSTEQKLKENHKPSGGASSKVISTPLYLQCRPKKSEAVLEKEKQMKFLRERFPKMESMGIHDVLSKHGFNIDRAINALEAKERGKEKGTVASTLNYASWKITQEKNEALKAAEEAQKMFGPIQPVVVKPVVQPVVVQPVGVTAVVSKRTMGVFSNSTKRKAKRMRTAAVSDESDQETADYKDNRVFNSDEDSDVELSNELSSYQKEVLEFFQTATANELQLMSFCSKKKAEMIVEMRPFTDWINLVKKLQESKSLSSELLNAAQDVLITRSNINNLMKTCRTIAQKMQKAVAASPGVKQQPALLNPSKQLTGYQMVGLNWLAVLHAEGVNGILADEMGLGKTIQVIAFLTYLKETGQAKNVPHLIIVPSSTLDNWRGEFEKWCPALKVFCYYGSSEERKMLRIDYFSKGTIVEYDVVLTTYSMVTTSPEEKKMFRCTQMHYVVFDEAHMLKNMNTQRYDNLIRIKAMNRILLTGTPLQNNLLELMSLLIFVMPAMFAGRSDDLKSLFQKNSKAVKQAGEDDLPAFERAQIKHAKDIMKPFVLRRLKRDVLKDLPRKTSEMIKVPLAPTQFEQYQNLVAHFQSMGSANSENGSYSGMTMMTDLRKLSNHSLLLKYFYNDDDTTEMARLLARDPNYKEKVVQYICDDLTYMSDFELHTLSRQYECLNKFELPSNLVLTSGKFLFLDKKLAELKKEGNRVLIFSQYVIMLNVMEEYLQLRNHTYLRLDGTTPVITRQELIDEYTNDPNIFVFLLSTRAGGLGINLTAADTVIIHDIDFNPYNDKQAEDRCHRMGQAKPVKVYRLIAQGTIEEGMWQMNQEKLKLEKEVTTDEAENPDAKSVVRLLSSVLGIDSAKVTNIVTDPINNS